MFLQVNQALNYLIMVHLELHFVQVYHHLKSIDQKMIKLHLLYQIPLDMEIQLLLDYLKYFVPVIMHNPHLCYL